MEFSHLTEHSAEPQETDKSTLEQISALAQRVDALRDEIKDLEDKAKTKKKELTKIEQELLPEAMRSVGLSKFTLSSGSEVIIKEDVSCSVKDYDKLYAFLEEHGDDALMKTSIEVGKLPKNILTRLLRDLKEMYDLEATSKLFVHPQTLNAYFRRLCGIGEEEDVAKVPLASIDQEMVTTFTFYRVTVKK